MPSSGNVYVDTDYAGGSSDGSQSDPWTSLWDAEADLTSLSGNATIICRGTADDTTTVTVDVATNGFTLTIKAARDADWSGTDDGFYGGTDLISDNHYLLKVSGSVDAIVVAVNDVVIDGLQIEHTPTNTFYHGIEAATSTLEVLRTRLRSTNGTGVAVGNFAAIGGSPTRTVDSNVIGNWNRGVNWAIGNFYNPTLNIFNNTIYGCTTGIWVNFPSSNGSAQLNAKNNVIGNSTTDFSLGNSGGATIDCDTNCSDDDLTGSPTSDANWVDLSPGGTESTDWAAAWTSPGTGRAADFHVKDASSPLADAGISVGEATDADDVTRSASYDIGAFDFDSGGGPTLKSGSDALSLSLTEAAAIAAASARSDTLSLSLGEATATLVSVAGSDTLGLSLGETATLAATLQGSDTLSLSLAESSVLAVSLQVADTLSLSVADAVSVFASVAASDPLAVGLDEAAVPLLFQMASDQLGLSVAEAAALAATVAAADTLGLTLTDGADALLARLARSDGLALGLTDAASLFATLSRADTLALSLTESRTLLALLDRADTLGLSLEELAAVSSVAEPGDVGHVIALLGSLVKTAGLTGSQLTVALKGWVKE